MSIISCAVLTPDAQVASGTPYTLNQSVIAGGGRTSDDGANTFSVTGAVGQALTDSSGAALFAVRSGFFAPLAPLAPTAATVLIGGKTTTATGRGIINVRITLTDSQGNTRTTTTTTFGRYRFAEVRAGETYILTAVGKRYTFVQPSQVINAIEDTMNVDFIANP